MVHFIAFDPPLQKLQCVSLIKTLISDLGQKWCFCPWDIKGGVIHSYNSIPQVQWNQRFLDPSLILHSMGIETRFLEPFWDPAYNSFWVLKPNWISGIRISKLEKVYLSIGNVIKLPIVSHGPFYFFLPHIEKIAMCLTKQNPSFWSRQKMMFLYMGNKGRWNK